MMKKYIFLCLILVPTIGLSQFIQTGSTVSNLTVNGTLSSTTANITTVNGNTIQVGGDWKQMRWNLAAGVAGTNVSLVGPSAGGSDNSIVIQSQTTNNAYIANIARINLAAPSDSLTVSSSGYVGVGTVAPLEDLQIGDTAAAATATDKTLLFRASQINAGGIFSSILFDNAYTNALQARCAITAERYTDNYGAKLNFFAAKPQASGGAQGNSNLIISVLGEGYVGINNPTPATALDIIAGTAMGIRIAGSSAGGYGYIQLGRASGAITNYHFGTEGDGTFRFWNGNWGGGSEIMRVLGTTNIMYVNSGVKIAIGQATAPNILSVLQNSATDPIADAWTTYVCNRTTKHIVEENVVTNYADSLASIPIYRWRRTPKINDEELLTAMIGSDTNKSKFKLNDFSQKDKDDKKIELETFKSTLPKFTTTRVGIMLDDPQIPKEICNDGSPTNGIDLVAWNGYLQAALRDEILARKALSIELQNAKNEIKALDERLKKLEK